jgi:flagellar biosynthesis GTPase FlhF
MRVFISHAGLDNEIVKQIVSTFEKHNIEYWVDYEQLEIGERLYRKINKGLQDSSHFLLVWTRNAEPSPWVEAEISAAKELGDRLVVISYKLDATALGVPFSGFVYPSARMDNLTIATEELIATMSSFEGQISVFKKRVKDEYENPPPSPTKLVVANFRKFEGAKYYVQQKFKNISTGFQGDQIAEYILSLLDENIIKLRNQRSLLYKKKAIETEFKDLKLDREILSVIRTDSDQASKISELIKKRAGLDKETSTLLLDEKRVRGEVNSAKKLLSKIEKASKRIAEIQESENNLAELKAEQARLSEPSFAATSSDSQIVERNNRLEQLKDEILQLERSMVERTIERKDLQELVNSEKNALTEMKASENELQQIVTKRKSFNQDRTSRMRNAAELEKKVKSAQNLMNEVQEISSQLKQLEKEKLIPIVGDYGSGKSALCHYLLYRLCKDSKRDLIPIFIPLGQLPKNDNPTRDLKKDIFCFIREEYHFMITPEQFDEYLSEGKFVFILDALDEMSTKLDQVVSQNHLNLIIELAKKCVTILTSRHTYLSDAMERLLLIEYNGLTKVLDFSPNEVRKYLNFRIGSNQARIGEIERVIGENRLRIYSETLVPRCNF